METDSNLRSYFRHELAATDARLTELLDVVCNEVAGATEGLLRDDPQAAVDIGSRGHWSDPLYEQLAQEVEVLVARQAPMASDLRYLLAVLRAVPELEQSAGLASEIGRRGGLGIADALTPRARAVVTRSGDIVTAMWQELRRGWQERRPVLDSLRQALHELHELHTTLTAEVAGASLSASVTMDMALIGRYYERLGDHAMNIARWLEALRGRASAPGATPGQSDGGDGAEPTGAVTS